MARNAPPELTAGAGTVDAALDASLEWLARSMLICRSCARPVNVSAADLDTLSGCMLEARFDADTYLITVRTKPRPR